MSRLLSCKTFALTLGLVALASVAGADIRGTGYTITASNADGSASYSIPAPTSHEAYWGWTTTERIEMRDPLSGNLVATLNPNNEGCNVHYVEDPVVALGFAVQAGAAPTLFMISSGTLAFAPIPAAEARSSGSYTLTDITGDGATLTPLGAKSYHSLYNGPTVFSDLVSGFASPAFTSTPASESLPAGPGFIPIGPAVDMRAEIDFVLSPFDLASGTTVYVIQQRPTPVIDATWSRIKSLTQ
ncbi:MAG TPA: hypothetical protein VF720_10710 [Candidatus Eisenbacteria bacterium]